MEAKLRGSPERINEDPFAHRAVDYAQANANLPDARRAERDRLLAVLPCAQLACAVDLQAASGYVGHGLLERSESIRIASVEPSRTLVECLPTRLGPVYAELHELPFASNSVSAVLCLAGTHHSDRLGEIVEESARILSPGGWLSFAEVERDSGPARWLNGFVDRWGPDGHAGRFVAPGELGDRLRACGLVDVSEAEELVPWSFEDRASLVAFCRSLFGLFEAPVDAIEPEIGETVGIDEGPEGVSLRWRLRYAAARAPRDRSDVGVESGQTPLRLR